MLICIFEAIKSQKKMKRLNLQNFDGTSAQGSCNKIETFLKKQYNKNVIISPDKRAIPHRMEHKTGMGNIHCTH